MVKARRNAGLWKVVMALSIMILPTLGGISRVNAQDTGLVDDTTYVLELNGDEVEWDDPWEFSEDLNFADESSESVGFTSEIGVLSILYLPSGIDLEQARDEFLVGFTGDDVELQTLDRGAYDNVSYSLDLANLEDSLFGLFTVYIDDNEYVRSYATLAPYQVTGDAIDSAKDVITINGEPIYEGVEGSGLQDLVDANADDFAPTDVVQGNDDNDADPTEEDEQSGDAEEYLSTVRDTYDELSDTVVRFDDLLLGGGDLIEADFEELAEINELWLNAPTVAAALDVPSEYEDIQAVYLDYADSLADAGSAFNDLLDSEQGSTESTQASEDLSVALNTADEHGTELEGLLDDAEADLDNSSDAEETPESADNNADPTEEDDQSGDAGADEYLTTVRDNYDDLSESFERFVELVGSGNLSDADVEELSGIIQLWVGAPVAAEDLDVPAEYEDLHEVYVDYTTALSDAGVSFLAFVGADPDSADATDALDAYNQAATEVTELGEELDGLLDEAGV